MSNKKQDANRKKDTKDLQKDLAEKREALRSFRFDSSGTKTTNVKEAKNLRKDIARILTEIRTRVSS